jgi:LysM repeat protein
MSRKLIWIFAVSLAVILLLSACERSAVAPQSQATPTEEMAGDQPTVALPEAYKTQTTSAAYTALALTMQPGAPSTISTTTPATPTSTRYWDASITPTTGILVPTITGNPLAATPTPGRPATYTLQQGEYPYCIARRLNINPEELMALNHLVDGAIYQPGLVLNIPQTGGSYPGSRALRPHPTTYTVQLDDTIYKIACVFGDVDPIYLAAFNSLAAPYTLQTGRVLNIP